MLFFRKAINCFVNYKSNRILELLSFILLVNLFQQTATKMEKGMLNISTKSKGLVIFYVILKYFRTIKRHSKSLMIAKPAIFKLNLILIKKQIFLVDYYRFVYCNQALVNFINV